MDYKGEFKLIDTEEKAYFLGFAYADGCISKKKGKGNYLGRTFRMSLADKDIIYRLQSLFPFFNIDTFDYSKYRIGNSKQYAIRKVSTELYNDLVLHGLLERKSGENSNNLKFPSINTSLIPHFIRGFFDGDGSINIASARPHLRRIEICSSSKNFLLQLKNVLEKQNIECPIFRERLKGKNKPLYLLEWVNSMDIIEIRNYFYKDATIFLDRKKEKFDSFTIIDKKTKNVKCIHCDNNSCQKKGTRMTKKGFAHRYYCINCKKQFSTLAQIKSDKLLENPEKDNQQPIISLND